MSAEKKRCSWLPFIIMACGIFYTFYLLSHVADEVFYSGDGGLKTLLIKQFARGELRAALDIPAPAWVKNLWEKGYYPFDPPFVYRLPSGNYTAFSLLFPLLSTPFFKLLGFKGLYILPALFLWLLWLRFLLAARKLGLQEKISTIILAVLIFATPLTIYGGIFWEHTFGFFLAFWGLEFLVNQGQKEISRWKALTWGIISGLIVWIRSETVCLVAVYCLLGIYFYFKSQQSSWIYFLIGSLASVLLYYSANLIISGHPLGVHSFQVIGDTMGKRFFQSSDIFLFSLTRLMIFMPVLIFIILALIVLYLQKKREIPFPVSYLILISGVFLILVPFLLPNTGGKQWGPRYVLVLVPIFVLLAGILLEFILKAGKKFLKYALLSIFIISSALGLYKNSYVGAATLIKDYRDRVKPALDFIRHSQNSCVIVNNQYVAQELEAAFEQKYFFYLRPNSSLLPLISEIFEKGYEHFLFLSYQSQLGRTEMNVSARDVRLAGIKFHYLAKYSDYYLYEGEILAKAQEVEDYVRETYLVPDKIYGFAPAHQYKNLGKVNIHSFLPENRADETSFVQYLALDDGIYLVRYYYKLTKITLEKVDQMKDPRIYKFQGIMEQFLSPKNRYLAKEIIFENFITTKKGNFLFFILKKIKTNSKDFKPEDLNKERIFWQSFIYFQNEQAFGPSVEVSREDSDTGGYDRSLWDIFSHKSHEYILIYKIVYESHNFEIFEKTAKGLTKVQEFSFGGL